MPAAIPNDGLDDRAAIQSALDSQGCAHLPAGQYDIDSIQVAPPARRPFMMLDAEGAELYGDGPGTRLAFRGSVGGQDWEGIRMTGAGSTVRDLSIATAAISNTNEQTHAVRLIGPATDAEISRVSFKHPIRVGEKAGDCIQLVGFNDGREIARVKIRLNDFVECDRSGVAAHSGTTGLEIVDNLFSAIGNTDLDFEGTGGTSDLLVKRNTFKMSPGPHGLGAIQLQLVDRARVTENVLDGRGIEVLQSDDAEIDRNTITLAQATGAPVIAINADSARTRIHDNFISRDSSAGVGALIAAGPRATGAPDQLEIEGNTLLQQTGFHVVTGSGVVGLYVRHNAIAYRSPVANEMAGVRALGSAGADGIRTTDVRVEDNTFDGALRAAVITSGTLSGAGTVDTSDNVATGATFGIFCDNHATQGRVLGPFTSTHDRWPAPLCGPAGFVTVVDPPADIPDPPTPPDEDPPGEDPPGEDPPIKDPPGADPPRVPDSQGRGANGTGDAGGTAGSDATAPVLSGVSLSRTAIATAARRGTVLRFTSSEAGMLTIRIERLRPTRKLATLTRTIKAGPGSIALNARIAGKPMQPGSYRLTLTARDAAGNLSKATSRAFTVLAG